MRTTFYPGDIICRREGLGIDRFVVEFVKGKNVYFHYFGDDNDEQHYYGSCRDFKLVPPEQISLFADLS